MTFEVSWAEDDQQVWHESRHPIGYVESTNPWTFATVCGRELDTATPPLPAAPAEGALCSACEAAEPEGASG
jgi:hypothetical protein